MPKQLKRLLVVGGPNGAGKTTVANAFLYESDWHYIGADRIAYELQPDSPESAAVEASREFVRRIKIALLQDRNLLIESTLSGRSIGRVLERAGNYGFIRQVAFAFVDTPETCIARVAQRVRIGGHHVPESDIRRRFYRSIKNFWNRYREMADYWTLSDNRLSNQREIAWGSSSSSCIIDSKAFQEFLSIVDS